MQQQGFVSYLLIALIVMMAGIIIGSQFVQQAQNLYSKASERPISLEETTTECQNNRAIVHLNIHMPPPDSYKVTRASEKEGRKQVISYDKHILSADYEKEPGVYSFDDEEVYPNTDYIYYLSINDKEAARYSVSTPDCSLEKSSCNGPFCLKLRENGCNGTMPLYLFEWTPTPDPLFKQYVMMRNNQQLGGPLTPAGNVNLQDTGTPDAISNYYIIMKKTDGTEVKSGMLTLTNKCF